MFFLSVVLFDFFYAFGSRARSDVVSLSIITGDSLFVVVAAAAAAATHAKQTSSSQIVVAVTAAAVVVVTAAIARTLASKRESRASGARARARAHARGGRCAAAARARTCEHLRVYARDEAKVIYAGDLIVLTPCCKPCFLALNRLISVPRDFRQHFCHFDLIKAKNFRFCLVRIV